MRRFALSRPNRFMLSVNTMKTSHKRPMMRSASCSQPPRGTSNPKMNRIFALPIWQATFAREKGRPLYRAIRINRMNRICFGGACLALTTASFCRGAELQEVARFLDKQVTGVAVSESGRVFVNFPNWSDSHTTSVAELIDGVPKPFPNEVWNQPGPAATHFICVQSVYIDARDSLWILDPASPKMQGTVADGPKLVNVNLTMNKSVRIIPFDEHV